VQLDPAAGWIKVQAFRIQVLLGLGMQLETAIPVAVSLDTFGRARDRRLFVMGGNGAADEASPNRKPVLRRPYPVPDSVLQAGIFIFTREPADAIPSSKLHPRKRSPNNETARPLRRWAKNSIWISVKIAIFDFPFFS